MKLTTIVLAGLFGINAQASSYTKYMIIGYEAQIKAELSKGELCTHTIKDEPTALRCVQESDKQYSLFKQIGELCQREGKTITPKSRTYETLKHLCLVSLKTLADQSTEIDKNIVGYMEKHPKSSVQKGETHDNH